MARPRNDTESIHVELPVLVETEKAYKISEKPEPKGTWLPKSQVIKGEEVADGVWEFEIPGWLAIQKRLENDGD